MSRIIVKGLPKYLTEERLKEHFLKRLKQLHSDTSSLLTDVRVLKNKAGESRRFAFIGFKDESDAFDAISYFNGSFIDTSKLEVSMAKSFADPRVPIPMREKRREALKRLREKEELLLEQKKRKFDKDNESKLSIDAEIAKNKQLQEFIETMKPASQVTSWEKVAPSSISISKSHQVPDEPDTNPLLRALGGEDKEDVDMFKLPENDSDDEYVDMKKAQEEEAESMLGLDDFENKDSNNAATEDGMAQDNSVSDLDWLKKRRIRIRESGDKVTEVDKNETKNEPEEQKEDPEGEESEISEEEKNIVKIRNTRRLFIRNIFYSATEDDFRKLFAPYGELEEVHIALDNKTGQSKGFAYILFKNADDAVNAYIELEKQIFQGRLLHILPAGSKKTHTLDEFDVKNLPLKKQRELKRKATASQQVFSWNSLYMNQNAVLTSVADSLGVEKSELFDPQNSSSGVKQALAEAHVINDVRKFFESRGVDIAKFENYKKVSERDDHVILVKNFPFGTTKEEIADLFQPFGKLERLLMPPSGTIAILQYRDITAARAAFAKLSFKRFKDGIIYLEKGPKGCFSRGPLADEAVADDASNTEEAVTGVKTTVNDLIEGDKSAGDAEANDSLVEGPTASIFVKNLNFVTTAQQLTDRFKAFTGFVLAQIKTKPDPKNPKKTLSMGFGFVEYRSKEQAQTVISEMDGTVIDGHRIQLKLSHRQSGSASKQKSSKKNSGKIIVKNLSFEATRNDVYELFSSFGQLKSVRVPKKFDKSARGFAFVEFLLPKEAENAMDQLQGVHLLGRRLVMQYAEQESDNVEEQIDKMTKKMKKQAAVSELAALRNNSKRKLDLGENDEENDGLNGF